jgi:hypothetical protein
MSFLKRRKRDKTLHPVGKRRRRYLLSLCGSLAHRKSFDQVETFCMFIGYPRSGHTLIGSLLDAHPNAVLADELDALKFVQGGFSERQIFYLSLRNSRRAAAAGRQRTGYSYHVPGQWQGRFDRLQVIGDKMGDYSALRLYKHPTLFESLHRKFSAKIRFVHVIRNPYDVISTMSLRDNRPLDRSIDRFFSNCAGVQFIKERVNAADIYDLRHEDFILNPRSNLKDLCDFFHLISQDAYLQACVNIVYKSPHNSRLEVAWNRQLIESVAQRIARFTFLVDYSYDNASTCSAAEPEQSRQRKNETARSDTSELSR